MVRKVQPAQILGDLKRERSPLVKCGRVEVCAVCLNIRDELQRQCVSIRAIRIVVSITCAGRRVTVSACGAIDSPSASFASPEPSDDTARVTVNETPLSIPSYAGSLMNPTSSS